MTIANDGSTLGDALRPLEQRLLDERPARVVLTDDSDTALAAALVAAKLGITVEPRPAASDAPSTNGQLIAQLAGTYTHAP